MATTRASIHNRYGSRKPSITSTHGSNRDRGTKLGQIPEHHGDRRRSSLVSITGSNSDLGSSHNDGRRQSMQSAYGDHNVVGQGYDADIQLATASGWKLVKNNLRRIVEYGHKEGILSRDAPTGAQATSTAAFGNQNDENENVEKEDKHDDDVVKIATRDLSLIHAAIPFLPVPVAGFCFILNVVGPGSGTIMSGLCALCMGQPRINFKEGRRFMTLLVNMMVGIAQLGTITFLLVGWFWSMAWGGLLLTHALQYREALIQHRQDAVATAAIEALTRDAILRRRDVRTLVQERKQGQAATSDYGRRKSVFARLGKIGKLGDGEEKKTTKPTNGIQAV